MHNNLVIYNANLVLPDSVTENGTIVIRDGKIADIFPFLNDITNFGDNYFFFDAENKWVMPGIIDIHTDAMDVEICPRAGADFPIGVAFRELERKMAGCGITTVYHSLHIGYEVAEQGTKSKYSRKEVIEEVYNASKKNTIIHNKIHIRFEITGLKAYDLSDYLIKKGYVSLYSFMDHTPGQGQLSYENFLNYAKHKGLNEEQAKIELQTRIHSPKIEGEKLTQLVNLLKYYNIPIASHDDDSADM
jgi:alpha-D-ribose 1-methylphosphonate 5-triphosphate diphosphatase